MSGSERVNTVLSGSGRVDDIKSHPKGRECGQHSSQWSGMGIERHRWESRQAEMSGSERVNTTLSRSGGVDEFSTRRRRNSFSTTMIVDVSNYRWRSPAFRAWIREHGVDMNEVLRIDVNEYTQTMKVYEFVRSVEGLPLTDYSTMRAAAKVREIKLMSPMPS